MKYIIKNEGPNRQQRNADIFGDKKSGTPRRSSAGERMRRRAGKRLDQNMLGRDKINALMRRAGVRTRL